MVVLTTQNLTNNLNLCNTQGNLSVVIGVIPTCGICNNFRTNLIQNNIPFGEININTDSDALRKISIVTGLKQFNLPNCVDL